MSEWKMPRCEGCGAQLTLGRDACDWCGREIPWQMIIKTLPEDCVVLYADNRPIAICQTAD